MRASRIISGSCINHELVKEKAAAAAAEKRCKLSLRTAGVRRRTSKLMNVRQRKKEGGRGSCKFRPYSIVVVI